MKRQGSSTGGQPPVKKPDASSADLRSKIGAKLQTLLNGIDTDSILYAKRRKQLYEDLFGKPKYSEIIIDPTIVIKEEPDAEESSSDSSNFLNSQNFLLSAKSRLTELLNKQQDGTNKYKDSGKENTLIRNRSNLSCDKSNSSQNPSCSKSPSRLCKSSSRNRNSTTKGCLNPSSESTNNDTHSKTLVVVVDDCMKSNTRTTSSPIKPSKCNLNTPYLEPNYINKQDGHLTSLDNLVSKKDKNFAGSKSSSPGSILTTDPSPSKIREHAVMFSNAEESASHIPYYNDDESEMVDDPIIPQVIVDIKVGEPLSTDGDSNFESGNPDPDVELLCVKQPTAEVITLEDNDDEVTEGNDKDIVQVNEFLHKCKQCGKSFRAESLLNFHIRMHGKSSSEPSSSSSHPFS